MKSFWLKIPGCLAILAASNLAATSAHAATVVALGASNTYGKGVARNQAFPAQLEAILRAKGLNVRVDQCRHQRRHHRGDAAASGPRRS